MKFKQLVEAQTEKRFDLFNAIAGRIKLDDLAHRYLLPEVDKSKKFRHTTDKKGAIFLSNNKDKSVQISASEIMKVCEGVETDGTIIVSATGEPVVWFPTDAFTFLGEKGIRWMDWGQFDYNNALLSDKIKKRYYERLSQVFKAYPDMLRAMFSFNITLSGTVPDSDKIEIDYLVNKMRRHLDNNYTIFSDMFISGKAKIMAQNLKNWMKENPKDAKSLFSLIMDIQRSWLWKASKELRPNLSKAYDNMKTMSGVRKKAMYQMDMGFTDYDEVVINNVVVRNLYLKYSKVLYDWIMKARTSATYERDVKGAIEMFIYTDITELKDFFVKLPSNLAFTFLDSSCSGKQWNKLIKMDDMSKELFTEAFNYLGIKEHKKTGGLQWYVKS